MSVEFGNGQEIRLHLPGGVFKANIIGKGPGDRQWILEVPDDNPVRRINNRKADEFDE